MSATRKGTASEAEHQDLGSLAALLGEGGVEEGAGEVAASGKPTDSTELASRLTVCADTYSQTHAFQEGQLVQWKRDMKNRRSPDYGQPIIVVEVLDEPVYDTSSDKSAGSPYFREPLTLVAGWLDEDGDFVCLHYDGQRMEPYVGA